MWPRVVVHGPHSPTTPKSHEPTGCGADEVVRQISRLLPSLVVVRSSEPSGLRVRGKEETEGHMTVPESDLTVAINNLGPDATVLKHMVRSLIQQGQSVRIVDFYGKATDWKHPQLAVTVPESKSVEFLVGQLTGGERFDYLVLNGAECFVNLVLENPGHPDRGITLHGSKDLPWRQMLKAVKVLRQSMAQVNLVIIVFAEEEANEEIANLFEDDDSAEILVIGPKEESQSLEAQRVIVLAIQEKPLDEALQEINLHREILPDHEVTRLQAYAYLRNGYSSEASKCFEQVYEHLQGTDRVNLADLYVKAGNPQRAFDVAKRAFDDSPLTQGVAKTLLKSLLSIINTSALEPKARDEWSDLVDRAYQSDGDNPEVINAAADCLNGLGLYLEAARLRRRLASLVDDPRQELLARFLDVLADPTTELRAAERRILDWISKYPDLKDEGHYKLGVLWQRESSYKAFHHWAKVSISPESPFACDAAIGRLSILEDNIAAAKALHLNFNSDLDKIAERKTRELLRNLELLSTDNNGYTIWGNYIDRAFTKSTWLKCLTKPLLDEISSWTNHVTNQQVSDSYLKRASQSVGEEPDSLTPLVSLLFLRKLKAKELPSIANDEDAYVLMQGALVSGVTQGNSTEEVWIRYEAAVLLSLLGRDQEAIDHTLSIFHLANGIQDQSLKRTARMLAFIAWGNVQCRIGHTVEGLASLLTAMRMSREIGEVGAFVEDGLNVLQRALLDHLVLQKLTDADQATVLALFERFAPHVDQLAGAVRQAMLQNDYSSVYTLLHDTVYGETSHEGDWAEHLNNFIAACEVTGRRTEASNLICKYADEAVQLLSQRHDLLPRVLAFWSSLLILDGEEPMITRLRLARRLLASAVTLGDSRRESLKYRGERSHLADLHRDVVVKYVEVLAMIHECVDFTSTERESALEEIVQSLSRINARSIVESRRHRNLLTDDLVAAEREYSALFTEISGIKEDTVERRALVERYNALQAELQQRHPFFKAVPRLAKYHFMDYQAALRDGEVLAQYVLTDLGMVTIVVSSSTYRVRFTFTSSAAYRNSVNRLGASLQMASGPTDQDIVQVRALCEHLSKPIIEPILEVLRLLPDRGMNTKLYLCPDLSLSLFSSALLACEDGWLVEIVDGIVNVVDFSQLIERIDYKIKGTQTVTLAATLGSEADRAVNDARAKLHIWTNQQLVEWIDLKNNNQDLKSLVEECRAISPGSVVLIGHGIIDANAGMLSGATSILGHKHTIWGDDLSVLAGLTDNLVLLSCSGGAPYEGQIESSTGVWNQVLSENFFGVVLCRWNVDVKASLELLERILSSRHRDPEIPMVTAMRSAQRTLSRTSGLMHPYYWAGLEYWGY